MATLQGTVVRRQELTCDENDLKAYGDKILLANEVIRVRMNDGTVREKMGDGVTAVGNLPYVDCFDDKSRALILENSYRVAEIEKSLGFVDEPFEYFEAVGNGTTAIPEGVKAYAHVEKIWGEYCTSDHGDQYDYVYENPPVRLVFHNGISVDLPTGLAQFGSTEHDYIYFEGGKAYYCQGTRFEDSYYEFKENLKEGETLLHSIHDAGHIIKLAEPIVTDISARFSFDGYVALSDVTSVTVESEYNSRDDERLTEIIAVGIVPAIRYSVGGVLFRVEKEDTYLSVPDKTVPERIAEVIDSMEKNTARINTLEGRLDASGLFNEVKLVGAGNPFVALSGSQKQYAKILKLWGTYGGVEYGSHDSSDQAPDYPQYVVADKKRVFTYPKNPYITSDTYKPRTEMIEAIAPSFGYDEENYIYTEGERWFYRQGGRYHYGVTGLITDPNEIELAADESACKWCVKKGGAFCLLKVPVVTDITDKIDQSPYIDIGGATKLTVWNAHKPLTVYAENETYYLSAGTAGATVTVEY